MFHCKCVFPTFSYGLELAVLLLFLRFETPSRLRVTVGEMWTWCISAVRWVLGFNEGTGSSFKTKSKTRGEKSDLLFQQKHYRWDGETVLKMDFYSSWQDDGESLLCVDGLWNVREWWEEVGGCQVEYVGGFMWDTFVFPNTWFCYCKIFSCCICGIEALHNSLYFCTSIIVPVLIKGNNLKKDVYPNWIKRKAIPKP